MSGLTFTKDPSSSLPDKPLGSPDIPTGLAGGTVSYDGSQTIDGIQFGFGGSQNAKIEAFNSPDDKDEDGVFGANGKFDEVNLPPQIVFDKSRAWLKYRFETNPKVSAGGAFPPVKFKIDGSVNAIFTDFHVHGPNENTIAAVTADLPKLRFAYNPDDVMKLAVNEALSYNLRGQLSASVTLSWSDVFTTNLSLLSQFLKSGQLLSIQTSLAASVTVSAGVVDDFKVIFSRNASGEVVIAVKKSKTSKFDVAGSAGVTVGFTDPNATQAALNSVIQGVAGQPMSVIDNILNKATLSNLNDTEREIIMVLANRLGFGPVTDALDDLKAKWDALKKKISDTVTAIAKAKVQAAFTYEYLRTKDESTLFQVHLSEADFRQHHSELMLCDIQGILDLAGRNPQILDLYLKQTKTTTMQAWGFSLSLGTWFSLVGLDKITITHTAQNHLNDSQQRLAFEGVRRYDGNIKVFNFVRTGDSWSTDFKAQMPNFKNPQQITTCDYQYGLYLLYQWEKTKLSESSLKEMLDLAMVWGIISISNIPEIINKSGDFLGNEVDVKVELKMEDAVFRQLLALASMADVNSGADALAKAMPYSADRLPRSNPAFRQGIYAPLWQYYFQNDNLTGSSYVDIADQNIEKLAASGHIPGGTDLFNYESGRSLPSTDPYHDLPYITLTDTFAGEIYQQSNTSTYDSSVLHKRWIAFFNALKSLNSALNPGTCNSNNVISDVFNKIQGFSTQSLNIRAMGSFLTDLAWQNNLLGKVERTFTITTTNGGGKSITFTLSDGALVTS